MRSQENIGDSSPFPRALVSVDLGVLLTLNWSPLEVGDCGRSEILLSDSCPVRVSTLVVLVGGHVSCA